MLSFPNAKINIGLYVTSKRPDGYHNLESIFYPIPLFDILEIVPVNVSTSLNLTGLIVPGKLEDNLVLKAYDLLKKDFQLPNVSINLHKLIPMGAGLGGGSSDAAFCLLNLNKQFELQLSEQDLLQYALKLGSDVPFFILNTPQYVQGRGELFSREAPILKDMYLHLVFSDVHVSTMHAYSTIKPKKPNFKLSELKNVALSDWKNVLRNDFEEPVFHKFPELLEIKQKLLTSGAQYVQMTGSGSCIFGVSEIKPKNLPDISDDRQIILHIVE
jgi:4-diphosphocytidyl-2-C-methyl-D-erythritol kinase